MPEIAIQGWFDFQNIYDKIVAEARPGAVLIELGVWKGGSLLYLALKAIEARKNLTVVGVDNFLHNDWDGYSTIQRVDRENGETRTVYEQCRDNLTAAGVVDFVKLIRSDTIEAASLFPDGSVDFLFIDDTHNSPHVQKEIAAWLPKMRRPSVMAGHDYPGSIAAGVHAHFPYPQHIAPSSWAQMLT